MKQFWEFLGLAILVCAVVHCCSKCDRDKLELEILRHDFEARKVKVKVEK